MEASEAASTTEYLVMEMKELSLNGTAEAEAQYVWVERQKISARSPKAAIAEYVHSNGDRPGQYVAVATRYFDPLPVKPETQTKLVFG